VTRTVVVPDGPGGAGDPVAAGAIPKALPEPAARPISTTTATRDLARTITFSVGEPLSL
jgi:hypothetical protein